MALEDEGNTSDKIYAYHSTGSRKECLRGALLDSRQPLYECHGSCACSEDCPNRVVDRGRKIPLQIFRTSDGRGWGMSSSSFQCSVLTRVRSEVCRRHQKRAVRG